MNGYAAVEVSGGLRRSLAEWLGGPKYLISQPGGVYALLEPILIQHFSPPQGQVLASVFTEAPIVVAAYGK